MCVPPAPELLPQVARIQPNAAARRLQGCFTLRLGLFLKGRSHFDSPEAPSLVAALLAEDTRGGHRGGHRSNSLFQGVS